MAKALATLLLLAAATGPAAAASRVLEAPDLFCAESFREAEAKVQALEAEVERLGGDLDRARLRRSQIDWIRFRGTNCDLLAAGEPERTCCLERETEKRLADLQLLLTGLGPVDFRSWPAASPIDEKEALRAHVLGWYPKFSSPVLPDGVLRVGDAQYLVAFSAAPDRARGLAYVNLRRGVDAALMEGDARLLRVLRDRGGAGHTLVQRTYLEGRVRWTEYCLLRLERDDPGLRATETRLALFMADAGSGRCDAHSATFLKLDKAVVPLAVRYEDVDRDGHEDISIDLEEIECRTQATSTDRLVFVARDAGFAPRRDSQP